MHNSKQFQKKPSIAPHFDDLILASNRISIWIIQLYRRRDIKTFTENVPNGMLRYKAFYLP